MKVAYDPGWHLTVDGRATPSMMVAPALLGVEVGPGTHRVVATFDGYGSYPVLVVVGVLTLVVASAGPAWWRRRRDRSEKENLGLAGE
jgi:uncharacterized membrane protein YfhO